MGQFITIKEIAKLILISLGCDVDAYKTLCNLQSTSKYMLNLILSPDFNRSFSEVHQCDINSFKRSCLHIDEIIKGHKVRTNIRFLENEDSSLFIALERKHLHLYEKFKLTSEEIIYQLEYNEDRMKSRITQLATLQLKYNGQSSLRKWTLHFDNGSGCWSDTNAGIFKSEDLYIPLHYIIHNNVGIKRNVWGS